MALIVNIEGNDGSGKGVQFDLLQKRLESISKKVFARSFPDLDSETGQEIDAILHGKKQSDPYEMAALYAKNRLDHLPEILAAIGSGAVLLFDRYVASNIVFQTERVEGEAKKMSMTHWITDMEYRWNGMPEPDLTVVLAVEPKVARLNMLGRDPRANTERLDIIEKDTALQERAVAAYDDLCLANPGTYQRVDCVDARLGRMRDKEVIHAEIWSLVARRLGIEH